MKSKKWVFIMVIALFLICNMKAFALTSPSLYISDGEYCPDYDQVLSVAIGQELLLHTLIGERNEMDFPSGSNSNSSCYIIEYDLSDVQWISSDESIATVDDSGVITGLKVGEITVTATYNYNGENMVSTKTIEVVNEICVIPMEPPTCTVNFNTLGGNSIDYLKSLCSKIDLKDFPTPEKAGYEFEGWFADSNLSKKINTKEDINYDTGSLDCPKLDRETTIYAKWKDIKKTTEKEDSNKESKDEVKVDDTSKKSNLLIISITAILFGIFIVYYKRKKSLN